MIEGPLLHRRPVVHSRTQNAYIIGFECKIRRPDGEWVDGVTYAPRDNLSEMYARELTNFRESFEDPK